MLHPILPTIVIENKRTAVKKRGGSRHIFKALQSYCYSLSCSCRKKQRGFFGEPERSAITK